MSAPALRLRYREAEAEARRRASPAADGRAAGQAEAAAGQPCLPLAPARLSAPDDLAAWTDAYLAAWRARRGA